MICFGFLFANYNYKIFFQNNLQFIKKAGYAGSFKFKESSFYHEY